MCRGFGPGPAPPRAPAPDESSAGNQEETQANAAGDPKLCLDPKGPHAELGKFVAFPQPEPAGKKKKNPRGSLRGGRDRLARRQPRRTDRGAPGTARPARERSASPPRMGSSGLPPSFLSGHCPGPRLGFHQAGQPEAGRPQLKSRARY